MNMHKAVAEAMEEECTVNGFINSLADNGFCIMPIEQRPFDSTVYRDGEMKVM